MAKPPDIATFLPWLLGPLQLQDSDGNPFTRRLVMRFVNATIVDVPPDPDVEGDTGRTEISLTGGGGGGGAEVPTGTPGDMVVLNADDTALSTSAGATLDPKILRRPETAQLFMRGSPSHAENYADFYDSNEAGDAGSFDPSNFTGIAKALWKRESTSSDGEIIADINLGVIKNDGTTLSMGNCYVTVTAEITATQSSGGANLAYKATFSKTSGTLTRIGFVDHTDATLNNIAATANITVDDNDNIKVISATTSGTATSWYVSLHVQIVQRF